MNEKWGTTFLLVYSVFKMKTHVLIRQCLAMLLTKSYILTNYNYNGNDVYLLCNYINVVYYKCFCKILFILQCRVFEINNNF